jgi:uncharacterized membrane protein YGL010W
MTVLEDSMSFYASYHHNFMNKLIHIVCVWPILFTAQVFFFYIPVPAVLSSILPNWTLPLSLFYGGFYFLVEQPGIVGPLAACLVAGGYTVTKDLVQSDPTNIWKIALVIHVLSWAAQIGSHKVFEKRSPAFLDNVLGALVMAPLFVLLEVAFPLGYKKELGHRIESIAVKNIAAFRKSQKSQ